MNEATIKQIVQQVSLNVSNNIDDKFAQLQQNLNSFHKQINNNRADLIKIDYRVDSLEQYTRICNLRFYGLQPSQHENTSTILKNFVVDVLKITEFTINDLELATIFLKMSFWLNLNRMT